MNNKLKRLMRDESGITALETAIILIAFVVVAAVFAFTILSAGTYSTEQSRVAIYAGRAEVQGSLELRGSIIATTTTGHTGGDASAYVDYVIFTISNVAGGEPVDLTDTDGNRKVVINYRDKDRELKDISWTKSWVGHSDGDVLLEGGELAQITVPLTAINHPSVNTEFVIEVKPPQGSVLRIERTTPANIDAVLDLH